MCAYSIKIINLQLNVIISTQHKIATFCIYFLVPHKICEEEIP